MAKIIIFPNKEEREFRRKNRTNEGGINNNTSIKLEEQFDQDLLNGVIKLSEEDAAFLRAWLEKE